MPCQYPLFRDLYGNRLLSSSSRFDFVFQPPESPRALCFPRTQGCPSKPVFHSFSSTTFSPGVFFLLSFACLRLLSCIIPPFVSNSFDSKPWRVFFDIVRQLYSKTAVFSPFFLLCETDLRPRPVAFDSTRVLATAVVISHSWFPLGMTMRQAVFPPLQFAAKAAPSHPFSLLGSRQGLFSGFDPVYFEARGPGTQVCFWACHTARTSDPASSSMAEFTPPLFNSRKLPDQHSAFRRLES